MRKQIAAANWKMNLSYAEGEKLISEIINAEMNLSDYQVVLLAVPFPYLLMAKNGVAGKSSFRVAAQNCHTKKSGAFTGEVSAEMLKSIGIDYCLVGHSERREYFNESDEMLAEKVNICLQNNITPLFCCGEALSIREQGVQNEYVEKQIQNSLFHLSGNQLTNLIIAYEPIWAIGTGKTATTEQAQEMHEHIRSVFSGQYGAEVAESIPILYGGSVKASNARELFSQKDVDGGLVGGASLIAADFITIINSLKK